MCHLRISTAALLAALFLAAPAVVRAQGGATAGETGAQGAPQGPNTPVAAPPASASRSIERWFELQTASLLGRYRYAEASTGAVVFNQVQDSVALKARFKLDAGGRLTINGAAGTGRTFSSGWNNTGLGTGDRTTTLFLRQLFVGAVPARGVSFSVGSFAFTRGQSTEITSYDNDGYLLGERISVSRPADLFLDEISVTNAFVGDLASPGVTTRLHRFDESNYRQLLAAKQVRRWLAVSGDYTRLNGVGTIRAAFAVRTPRARVVDLVQGEQYRRGGTAAGFGFAFFVEKTLGGKAIARAGYADVDAHYGGLNADKFSAGRRWYAQSDFLLTRDLTAWVFVTRPVGSAPAVPTATRIDVVFTFNAMGPIRRAGLFR